MKNCVVCGARFEPKTNATKCCSDRCRAERIKYMDKLRRERKEQEERRAREGRKESVKAKRRSTICKRSANCIYGSSLGVWVACDYIGKTGKMRGGYPDECTHFKQRAKKLRGNTWK